MKPQYAPCFQCQERRPLCHANCERYAAYDAERKAEREARLKCIPADSVVSDSIIKAERRANKKKN